MVPQPLPFTAGDGVNPQDFSDCSTIPSEPTPECRRSTTMMTAPGLRFFSRETGTVRKAGMVNMPRRVQVGLTMLGLPLLYLWIPSYIMLYIYNVIYIYVYIYVYIYMYIYIYDMGVINHLRCHIQVVHSIFLKCMPALLVFRFWSLGSGIWGYDQYACGVSADEW